MLGSKNYDYKEKVLKKIESMKERIIEVSKTIHHFAEVGNMEFKSSKLLADELEKSGFKVEKGIAGMQTAFKAICEGNPGPTIAFLAEYDALPELGHACGHNIIGTSATFAGIALTEVIKDLSGRIAVIGTPDEEGAGGKIKMLEAGVFQDVDVAIMNHPLDRNCAWFPTVAVVDIYITFRGKAAHYATPHKGANALDAAIATLSMLNIMRHGFRPDVIFGYVIEEGGLHTVIVPEKTRVKVSVKAQETKYLAEIVDKIKRCAAEVSNAFDVKAEIDLGQFYEESIPNLTLIQVIKNNFDILGVECEDPLETARYRFFYSTDFGNISRRMPAVSFCVSVGRSLILHTPEFARAVISDEGNKSLLIATKVMALTAIDLLINQSLIEKAKEEFERYRSSGFTNLPLLPLY